jgi:hypothetical protein
LGALEDEGFRADAAEANDTFFYIYILTYKLEFIKPFCAIFVVSFSMVPANGFRISYVLSMGNMNNFPEG